MFYRNKIKNNRSQSIVSQIYLNGKLNFIHYLLICDKEIKESATLSYVMIRSHWLVFLTLVSDVTFKPKSNKDC